MSKEQPREGIKHSLHKAAGFIPVSNAFTWGLPYVSEQAKLTLLLLDSLDWENTDRSRESSETWYSRAALAKLRRVNVGTLAEHLRELHHFGLLVRHDWPGQSTLWEVLPPSNLELERALFIKQHLKGVRSAEWPGDFDLTFEHWARENRPNLIPSFDKLQQLQEEWSVQKQARQSKSKRGDMVQAALAELRLRQVPTGSKRTAP